MSAQLWILLGTFAVAAGGVIGSWLQIRQQGRQSRTTDAQQIIDQLQEERTAREEQHRQEIAAVETRHRDEMTRVRTDLAEVRKEAVAARREVGEVRDRMDDRERAWSDYAAALRAHIDRGDPPPPPPWPPALMRRRTT